MSTEPTPTPPPLIPPSYIVRGQDAIMHATITGARLYHLQNGGPVSLRDAMNMDHNNTEMLFAAVYVLPSADDRQMIKCIDVLNHNQDRLKEISDEIHAKDMRTIIIIAVLLVLLCIVFSACLILPRLV